MSRAVIQVEGLGKRYRIGERERYLVLRDLLANALRAPVRLLRSVGSSAKNHQPQHIWALKDVSFGVNEGEVLGIIGRNGAGKTTLLKILARITRPTEGFAEVRGRMGSLLEVGTGFHPELTGRENVYLSGAILGMKKKEIERKFDEIVAFAEVERFIETPLKHYSSGMQVRLAFAVAAHLEPEILLIDEVLAVGDTAFQRKCLGKMKDVAHRGRTVLFVSHDLGAINKLCSRAIFLRGGQVRADGETGAVTDRYLNEVGQATNRVPLADRTERSGDGRIRFVGLYFEDAHGEVVPCLRSGAHCRLVLAYECPDGTTKNDVVASFAIKDHFGIFLVHHRTNFSDQNFDRIPPRGAFVCDIPNLPLAPGNYSVNAFVGIREVPCDSVEDALVVTVEAGDFFGTGHQGMPGVCRVLTKCAWALKTQELREVSEQARPR